MRKYVILAVSISVLSGLAVLAWTALSQEAHPAAANSCLSIPACSFQLSEPSDFWLYHHLHNEQGSNTWWAPVNLPGGSKIKKIILICKDENASKDITLKMFFRNRTPSSVQIAALSSSGSVSGWQTFSTTAISPRTVNNFKNCYYISVFLPGTDPDYYLSHVYVLYDAP